MRVIRASAIAIAVGLTVLGTGAVDAQAPAYTVLPAQITIEAGKTIGSISYRIGRDGRIRRIHRLGSPWARPSGGATGAGGIGWALRKGHLVIGRGNGTLWRSRGAFRLIYGIGGVEVGNRTVAFSYGNNLYLAPLGGAERRIAPAENALGFTRGGLYTLSWVRGLLLRSDTGAILKTIVHWTPAPVVVDGRLYFIAHGVLMSARGTHIGRLVSLARLGMSQDAWLQPVGRLLELMDDDRLMLLRADGSVFASTPLPRSDATFSSFPVPAGDGTTVAFALAAGKPATADPASLGHGTDTVYLLRAGSHAAAPVYSAPIVFQVCLGVQASLEWHGSWLLYGDSDNDLAAIDTAGPGHAVDLSRLVRRQPGAHHGFTAYWRGQPPAFQ